MKKKTLIAIIVLFMFIITSLHAQNEKYGNWTKDYNTAIKFRTCADRDGHHTYQFFNEYSYEVHFYAILVATDRYTTGTDFNSGI